MSSVRTPMFFLLWYLLFHLPESSPLLDESKLERNQRTVCNVCSEEDSCTGSNMVCVTGMCQCDYGYTWDGAQCVRTSLPKGQVEGSCDYDGDCQKVNAMSMCINNRCKCKPLYVRGYNTCLKEKNHGDACEHHSQCGSHQYCNCNGMCQCTNNYVFDEQLTQSCLPVSPRGGTCQVTVQCNYQHSKCRDRVCQCEGRTANSRLSGDCVPTVMELDISVTLPEVTYTEKLNDWESPEYRAEEEIIDAIKINLQYAISRQRIKVTALDFVRFIESPPFTATAVYRLIVNNPDYRIPFFRSRGRIGRLKRNVDTEREFLNKLEEKLQQNTGKEIVIKRG